MVPPAADTAAFARLLQDLEDRDYRFVTPTPASHARVLARPAMAEAHDLRGVFGWSLPFREDAIEPAIVRRMADAGVLAREGDRLRATVRASRVCGVLFLHSAYPTDSEDAVFLGPDTYRFALFTAEHRPNLHAEARLVDLGAGAGVGAILLARQCAGVAPILVDVNPRALALAAANAAHAGVPVTLVEGSGLHAVAGPLDCVIANPPFIVDPKARAYRDGGDMHGAQVSLDWTLAAAGRLRPGGRVLLYTGSAIVGGEDGLRRALEARLPAMGCTLDYRELDPDIFGEELGNPGYQDVERIAAVGAVVERG